MNAIRNLRWFGLLVVAFPLIAFGASTEKGNLLGKFFVNSVNGNVVCVIDGRVISPAKGDSFIARGAVIETKAGSKASLVFSNQTSLIVDENTRLEVETFEQEFFPPNNNLRVEPSNSSTMVELSHGRVLISTPTLRSGTTMGYRTNQATVWIKGEKVVVETDEKRTHVLVVSGAVTVDSHRSAGPAAVVGKRLVTGEEAFFTGGASPGESSGRLAERWLPPPSRRVQKPKPVIAAVPIRVAETGYVISATPAGVTLTSPSGVGRTLTGGTITNNATHSPISLRDAITAEPQLSAIIRSSLKAATDSIRKNSNDLSPGAATRLISDLASAAATLWPGEASEFAVESVSALRGPASSTAGESSAASTSVIDALVRAARTEAVHIASSAASGSLEDSIAIAAAAANAAPEQAPQIAFAVIRGLLQQTSRSRATSALQSAAAVAAAVSTSAPSTAALTAASALQALLQDPSSRSTLADAERAATIAAATVSAAPDQAPQIVTAVMETLAPTWVGASSDDVAQSIATLGAAVTAIVPAQAEKIGSTIVRLFLVARPNASPDTIADTTGLVAAVITLTAPDQASAVNAGIAAATNQSITSVQANAARSTALAFQISQQIPAITQSAGFAMDQSHDAAVALAAGAQLMTISDASTVVADEADRANATGDNTVAPDAADDVLISQLAPAALASLAADLDAAQAAQTSVQFNPEPDDDGTFTLQPTPTTPPTLPVELVTSPANGAG